MIRALIIDNYDSFTYNLYQLIGELLSKQKAPFVFDVVRNDAITLEEIRKKQYNRIIISPGPGDPSDPSYFGVCSQVLLELGQLFPFWEFVWVCKGWVTTSVVK
jgi:anthranilate synthase, component II (EC 4.1.3.27)